jgi:uncharacterized membrane protein
MSDEQKSSVFSSTAVPTQTSALAMVSLISGILCWFAAPLVGAIVAVVTGHMARNEIRKSGSHLIGDEMAKTGMILGYLHLAVTLLGIFLVVLIIILFTAGIIGFPLVCGPYIHINP